MSFRMVSSALIPSILSKAPPIWFVGTLQNPKLFYRKTYLSKDNPDTEAFEMAGLDRALEPDMSRSSCLVSVSQLALLADFFK